MTGARPTSAAAADARPRYSAPAPSRPRDDAAALRVLVVDDEPGLRHTLSLILGDEGHVVRTAGDGASALSALDDDPAVDLVLCDLRMPGMDGLEFLARFRERYGERAEGWGAGGMAPLVVAMSAYGDNDAAIDAMRRGAYDFISKPFRADQIVLVLRKAVERERLRRRVSELQDELTTLRHEVSVGAAHGIVGRSAAVRTVLEVARKVARYPSTVLVTGESGTGKELVARLVHAESPRAAAPFVAINCAAIPEALLESELFGHTKGAFTGASADRRGLFEEADGGTLFLDEIAELPVTLQVKLLRALQEGEVRRVGDNASRTVDVRVVAATARDLDAEVAAGRFRADLFYRVNVVRLHLPPLRERSEDVPELVRHFADSCARRFGLEPRAVSAAAMRLLVEYGWPGNVRELENAIERAVVLAEGGDVSPDHLPPAIARRAPTDGTGPGAAPPSATSDLSIKRQGEALERTLIAQALERTGGNRTRAAQLLELSPRALLYKIRDYALDR
ncbi:MAG TPA: sigma-54 dependent transcriptional regulator [Gemmatimonadaceae bacterium]|nr:sigma-54 dependent transcriptional regulator [Gemmatimonadaceae bacterium]